MPTQAEKGLAFRALHHRDYAFAIPNPWDVGSARLLAYLGFEALATTSAGFAFSIGLPDNVVDRGRMMAHAAAIATATNLPVSADLENGYGDSPEIVAETIRLAADAGLAGASIEDMSRAPGHPIYDIRHAAERIRAAADAARALPFAFTLTARAENFVAGRPDLADTIERLQAYQEAGADVLYAPGLASKQDIAAITVAVDRPVNVVMGLDGLPLTLDDLSQLGVKRVSIGSALARVAFGAFLRAARGMREKGAFEFQDAISYRQLNSIFSNGMEPDL